MNRPFRRRLTPLLAVLATVLLALGGAGTATARTAPTLTNPSTFIRVGHLAPALGPVDVYLTPDGGAQKRVVEKAPYGAISGYETLAPGGYTLSMRAAGADPRSPVLLSAPVSTKAGASYTVLVTGTPANLVTRVVRDDLTPPPPGDARVRLLQGSPAATKLTVTAVQGPVLARDVAYGTATGYGSVPQGRWTLKVTNADGSSAMSSAPVVDLVAGTVNSLVVTDSPDGRFAVNAVTDSAGIDTAVAPGGGVETGGGGTATNLVGGVGAGGFWSGPADGVALGLLSLTAVGVVLRRRSVRA